MEGEGGFWTEWISVFSSIVLMCEVDPVEVLKDGVGVMDSPFGSKL